jgi:hypothetical protein
MVDPNVLDTQRRMRRVAMTSDELDDFLGTQRVCRVATVSATGAPHNVPLWFVWDGTCLWLYSVVKSQRWTDLMRDPRVSAVVDTGDEFFELRGAELRGTTERVGQVPRTGAEPLDDPELASVERAFAAKYAPGDPGGAMRYDGRHAWLRLRPAKIASWDHRKIR